MRRRQLSHAELTGVTLTLGSLGYGTVPLAYYHWSMSVMMTVLIVFWLPHPVYEQCTAAALAVIRAPTNCQSTAARYLHEVIAATVPHLHSQHLCFESPLSIDKPLNDPSDINHGHIAADSVCCSDCGAR